MKKHFVSIFVALFFVVLPLSIYAMDELEKAYKDQLEGYNSEISLKQKLFKVYQDSSIKSLQLANDAMALGGQRQANMAMAQYDQTDKKAADLQAEIKELKNKRRELKIKLLEKYQTLPEWWAEPDNTK